MNCMTALTAIGVDHGADRGALMASHTCTMISSREHQNQQCGVVDVQAHELGPEDSHGGPVAPGLLPQHPPANGADHRSSAFPSAVFIPKASINEPAAFHSLENGIFLPKSAMEKSHEIFLPKTGRFCLIFSIFFLRTGTNRAIIFVYFILILWRVSV